MRRVDSSITISWSIHDSWTETLAGAHFLINIFGEGEHLGDKAHLCRLVLISSNHLIEKLFFDLVLEALESSSTEISNLINKEMDTISLYKAMRKWPQILTPGSTKFNFEDEPLISADELRKQRNKSIHKESQLVSLEMAKKSLYTAVEVCKLIWEAFHPGKEFKYKGFLDKYPVEEAGYYSTSRNVNLRA